MGNKNFRRRVSRCLAGTSGYLVLSEKVHVFAGLLARVPRDPKHSILLPLSVPARHQASGSGMLEIHLPLPDNALLRGRTVYCQALLRDKGSASGWSTSNALRIQVQ